MELFDDFQDRDLAAILDFLPRTWARLAATRRDEPVAPTGFHRPLHEIVDEPPPAEPQPIAALLEQIDRLVIPNAVKTSHPLFLAYVTPPSLDVCALGDALAALLNQNVCFEDLSPIGTALEETVVRWLGKVVGYGTPSGGVLVSGGSMANLYGLALGRRMVMGEAVLTAGNYLTSRRQRVYCSEHVHRSVFKAAAFLGIGSENVVSIPADDDHRIRLDELERQIEQDLVDPGRLFTPTTIVGAAGTRLAGAFDDLEGLHQIARRYGMWLHVDAAYGGFLRMAPAHPAALDGLALADSVTLDPHKLLFVPFDCGCFLVQDRNNLLKAFAVEGEYLERSHAHGIDYADLGLQLGRPMRGLKVWLALKYVGLRRFGEEMARLLGLAAKLRDALTADADFELLAPVAGTVVCFRWRTTAGGRDDLDAVNKAVRDRIITRGLAYINQVTVAGRTGLRVCMTNFRTEEPHLAKLLDDIRRIARELTGQ